MKSVSPTGIRHAAAMREDAVRPGQVTTGTPIHRASSVVIPPVGEGIERDVDLLQCGEMPDPPRVIEKCHAVGCDAFLGEHGQHRRPLTCFVEQAVLEHQARSRQRAQDFGPGAQHGIEHLRQPIERAEGHVTARQRGQRRWLRQRVGNPVSDGAGQVGDPISELRALGWRHQHGIGKQIVDRCEAAAGRLAPGVQLDRRGLAGACEQPAALHVSHQLDQDVDAVGADQFGQLFIGKIDGAVPCSRAAAKIWREVILLARVRVADDLESRAIMMDQHAAERIGAGLVAEMAADVSDAQAAAGIAIVGVRLDRGSVAPGVTFVPPGAFGLLVGRRGGGVEVEGEDQIAVEARILGP